MDQAKQQEGQIPVPTTAVKNGKKSDERLKLTRSMFLVGGRPKMRVVELPEFDNALCKVRAMSGGEMDWVQKQSRTEVDMEESIARIQSDSLRAQVVAWCTLDYDTERPLFSIEDVEEIREKDAAIVGRLFGVANMLSRVKESELEKIVGDFPPTPGKGSSSI